MIPLDTTILRGLGKVEGSADRFTGVQVDSRRVASGDLFVAVGCGSEYLDEARGRGAAQVRLRAAGVDAETTAPQVQGSPLVP